MKEKRWLIFRLFILIFLFMMFVFSLSNVFAFTELATGIGGKFDAPPREVWWFGFGFNGASGIGEMCMTEEDGGFGIDDTCCVGFSGSAYGAILQQDAQFSDIQGSCISGCSGSSCKSPDGAGDNPQDVFWRPFGTYNGDDWGFPFDIYINKNGRLA